MAYYEQPGRTTSIDKDGKQITTINYIGTEEAPRPSGVAGTLKFQSVTKSEAGQVLTQYQIEVDSTSAKTEPATYEYVSSVRSVPIETHPNFSEKFLTAEDKKKIKDAVQIPDRSPTFDDTKDRLRAISLYGYLIDGVDSYYVPSMIVRKTYQASSPPVGKKIGKISPGITAPGMLPSATFLLISISARGTAGAYTVTEEYEMSGDNGWDTFLYGS